MRDRNRLDALRTRIAAAAPTLFDPKRYARELESTFTQMTARDDAGLPAAHIDVAAT